MVFVFNKEVFLDLEETYRLTESDNQIEAYLARIRYAWDLVQLESIEKMEEV